MFDIGLSELAVIAFVAVLVFGPDKLPELARQAGRFLHKAKTFANSARDELRTETRPRLLQPRAARPRPPHHRPQARHRGDGGCGGGGLPQRRGLRPLTAGEIPPYDVEAT